MKRRMSVPNKKLVKKTPKGTFRVKYTKNAPKKHNDK